VSLFKTAQVSVTVDPDPTAPAIAFSASPSTIGVGQTTTLSWNVTSAVGVVTVSLNGSAVATSGSISVSPATTTTYQLTATSTELGSSVSSSAGVTVTVVQQPVITFKVYPSSGSGSDPLHPASTNILLGQSATLSWSVANSPDTVSIDNGVGSVVGLVSCTVSPTTSTIYTLTAKNLGGTATAQVTVNITPLPVIVSFTASPPSIVSGRSSTLAWNVQSATGYTITTSNSTSGPTPVTGTSAVVAPTSSQTYTLTATNDYGSTTASVTVTVTPAGILVWLRDILYLGNKEIAEVDAQGIHAIQSDHLGSPFYVLDGTGGILGRQKYLPFGETLDQRGSLTTAKGFTNHEQTDPSGLIYMQARFYAPQYHRFGSPDPARDQHFEETQSWNIYSYVQNQPTMMTDPTGMLSFKDVWKKVVNFFTGNDSSKPSATSNDPARQPKTPNKKTKAKNAKEVREGIENVKNHLGKDYQFAPSSGVRTPDENAKVNGSPTSDHVVSKEEEGKKGAQDGHWKLNGKIVDKEVHETLVKDKFKIGDGYQEIYHGPYTGTFHSHWHLGWNEDREGTEYKHEGETPGGKGKYPVDVKVN